MGGGSGGSGGISSSDVDRLTKAAEARLRQIDHSTILIACEQVDRRSLDSHVARSALSRRITVEDGGNEQAGLEAIGRATVVVVFTDGAVAAPFLNRIVEAALAARKQGVHVRVSSSSLVPSKATAYRWPSMSWDRMEELFS